MQLHLVGGFLGSGKTTAIIAAARLLMQQGMRVGVITNDQGKYLVDTAFFRLDTIPTVEVTGGCFCCNYDSLDGRLDELIASAQPDIIFAESVGSCADIIATVVKPLLALRQGLHTPTSYSVFTDARLLRLRLLDLPLPFSDNVVYIFDKQIEETALLVINKIDLLTYSNLDEIHGLCQMRYPEKSILLQNSLNESTVIPWIKEIQGGKLLLPKDPVEVDYQRYGDGEARMAWLDSELTLKTGSNSVRPAIIDLVTSLAGNLRSGGWSIGHLKLILKYGGMTRKLSFTSIPSSGWESELPDTTTQTAHILFNARVEMPAEELHQVFQNTLQGCQAAGGAVYQVQDLVYFHPSFPEPTHRSTT